MGNEILRHASRVDHDGICQTEGGLIDTSKKPSGGAMPITKMTRIDIAEVRDNEGHTGQAAGEAAEKIGANQACVHDLDVKATHQARDLDRGCRPPLANDMHGDTLPNQLPR